MKSDATRLTTLRNAALGIAVAGILAGCTGSSATMPPPGGATAAATPVATTAPTQATTAPPTAAPTAPPTAALTAPPTATPVPTDTPAPATPTAAPTSPAAICTGNDKNKEFIAEAAAKLTFDVYCAVLPSRYWVAGGKYTLPAGGTLELDYADAAGASIVIQEGNWCSGCGIAADHHYGAAAFDGITGDFWSLTDTWIMVVPSITDPSYMLRGRGMSKANFLAWAAALKKVPKS
jgi:hypothetical protein